jgi:hypothetical protein
MIRKRSHLFCFVLKDLDDLVEAALQFYGRKKMLDNKPLPLNLEKDNDPRLVTSPLKFPGKLAIDVLNNRLFISDSNHNRIVGSLSPSLSDTHTCTHAHTQGVYFLPKS